MEHTTTTNYNLLTICLLTCCAHAATKRRGKAPYSCFMFVSHVGDEPYLARYLTCSREGRRKRRGSRGLDALNLDTGARYIDDVQGRWTEFISARFRQAGLASQEDHA